MPDEDVTQADSSPAEGTVDNADATAVTGEPGSRPDKRSIENIYGEFSRKFSKSQEVTTRLQQLQEEQSRKLDSVLQYLASAQQAPARQAITPTQGQGEVTDEQLFSLAQSGNQDAFREWNRRIAEKEYEKRSQADRHQSLIDNQLNNLVTKYPVLRDAAHPLTQHAHQAYQLLVQNGYPAGKGTLLEAAKVAIADRPDIVSEIYTASNRASEQMRQTASQRAQTGVTGVTHRNEARTSAQAPKVSAESAELAKRMGVKDPAAAKLRHQKRMEQGQSSFGGVAAFVREDEE